MSLPANPKAVADAKVGDLASLGVMHKPPTPREYEHAALDVALGGAADEEVFAVLAHLDGEALERFAWGITYLGSALDWERHHRGIAVPRD